MDSNCLTAEQDLDEDTYCSTLESSVLQVQLELGKDGERKKTLMRAEMGIDNTCQMRKLRIGVSCDKSWRMIELLKEYTLAPSSFKICLVCITVNENWIWTNQAKWISIVMVLDVQGTH